MGKPLADSIFEIKKSAWAARHLAETGEAYLKPQPLPGIPAQIVYESLGPIFSVQPWNVPFWQVLRFFNTRAVVGNAALIEREESVQGCAEAIEKLVRDAGGPEGLYVNLAIPIEACAAVIADPRVRAVTVTGSVRAGRAVASEAAQVGKRAVLELGGSDPFIVLEDADLAKAVQLAVTSRYFNNSEGCICAKRFLVAESLFYDFTKAFVEQSKALPMGDPMKESIQVGPLALAPARQNLHRQVLDAVRARARILTRSDPRAPFGGVKASGYGRELGAPGARELTNPKLIWQGA